MLIHCNLNHVQGIGYTSPSPPPVGEPTAASNSVSHLPDHPSHDQQTTSGGGTGSEVAQSSRSHVGFADSPEVVDIVEYTEQAENDMPPEPSTSWGEAHNMCMVLSSKMLGKVEPSSVLSSEKWSLVPFKLLGKWNPDPIQYTCVLIHGSMYIHVSLYSYMNVHLHVCVCPPIATVTSAHFAQDVVGW